MAYTPYRTAPTTPNTGRTLPARPRGYGAPSAQAPKTRADYYLTPKKKASTPFSSYLDPTGRINLGAVGRGVQEQFDSANSANEGRYDESLGLARQSRDESLGYLDKYGTDAKEQIGRTANDDLSSYDADMTSRGLYNTSFADTDKRRIKEGRDRQLAAVDERANLLRSDVSRQGYGDIINVLGSRVDQGPNVDSYLSLVQNEARLRAEESARNADQANLHAETANRNAQQPTSIVNGVPQYGQAAGGGQPQVMQFGTPTNGGARSMTSMGGNRGINSMGGRQLTPNFAAGTAYDAYGYTTPNAPVGVQPQQQQYGQNAYLNPQPQNPYSPYTQQTQAYGRQRYGRASAGSNRPR